MQTGQQPDPLQIENDNSLFILSLSLLPTTSDCLPTCMASFGFWGCASTCTYDMMMDDNATQYFAPSTINQIDLPVKML